MSNHTKLVKDILKEFGSTSIMRIWSNNTGAIKTEERFIKFGLKGSADILGILFDGKFIAIEIKVGRDRQSKDQIKFENMIIRFGGIYILARSISDVEKTLELEGYIL